VQARWQADADERHGHADAGGAVQGVRARRRWGGVVRARRRLHGRCAGRPGAEWRLGCCGGGRAGCSTRSGLAVARCGAAVVSRACDVVGRSSRALGETRRRCGAAWARVKEKSRVLGFFLFSLFSLFFLFKYNSLP